MANEVKQFIESYIKENNAVYHEMSDKIWERPELGMEEFEAFEIQTSFLEENGFTVEKGVAGMPTAYVATYGEGSPVIGFSSEYDALPGLSQKISDVKDPVVEGAPGQGCGHNLLGVAAMFAVMSLKEAKEKLNLPGTIKLFGTPAEEICVGKPFMGNAGVFNGVDLFLDWHPMSYNAAQYLVCHSYFNVKYHFSGRTSHGNSPWHGRSALDAAILQAHAIEMLREHLVPGYGEDAAHTINYTFSDTGPEFASVVPDKASLWCIGRFTNSDQVKEAIARIDNCADGAALATGTTVRKEYITASHNMIPNSVASKALYDNLVEIGPVDFTEEEKETIFRMQENEGVEKYWEGDTIREFCAGAMAVTDAAEYSWVAPYGLFQLATGPGRGWHNWMVTMCSGTTYGYKGINKAAQILASTAIDFIDDPELLQKAQDEFNERTEGLEYGSLLPPGTNVPLDINKATMDKYR